MKSNVSVPVIIAVVVVVLAIVAFVGWRSMTPPPAPVNDKGIPLVPVEVRDASKRMSDDFTSGKDRPSLTPPTSHQLPPAQPPFRGAGPR